jgi:hypothetical protein
VGGPHWLIFRVEMSTTESCVIVCVIEGKLEGHRRFVASQRCFALEVITVRIQGCTRTATWPIGIKGA